MCQILYKERMKGQTDMLKKEKTPCSFEPTDRPLFLPSSSPAESSSLLLPSVEKRKRIKSESKRKWHKYKKSCPSLAKVLNSHVRRIARAFKMQEREHRMKARQIFQTLSISCHGSNYHVRSLRPLPTFTTLVSVFVLRTSITVVRARLLLLNSEAKTISGTALARMLCRFWGVVATK